MQIRLFLHLAHQIVLFLLLLVIRLIVTHFNALSINQFGRRLDRGDGLCAGHLVLLETNLQSIMVFLFFDLSLDFFCINFDISADRCIFAQVVCVT